jgi:putative spermidine/putrescine transport system substrate-binding protein
METTTMNDHNRRIFIMSGVGASASLLLPGLACAADTLVAATFPGTWNDAHSKILVPWFKNATKADVALTVQLATDQVAKLQAAGGKPPFDVAIMDEGPLLDAIKQDLLVRYPADKSANWKGLLPMFQDEWGPKISMQVIGIGYNPKKIKTPPKAWSDLNNPAYKGRVGLTSLNSTLGMAYMVELARLHGGGESNMDPAFKALKDLLPNVGAISANLGAHAALFQQEQIDIAPYNFNFVETLKGKGVDIAFVVPDSGPVAWRTSLHIVKNAARPDLAFTYIEGAITPDVQIAESKPPYDIIPTLAKVPLTLPMEAMIAKTPADLAKLRFLDWKKINENRSATIERFNREIKV